MDLCVVRMMGGDVTEAIDGDAETWLGPEPGGQGLGDTEVEEGGERTTLADTS